MAIANPIDWRPGTSQWIIAETLVRHGMDRRKAFAVDIRPNVGTAPLIFQGKLPGGGYGPLPIDPDQCRRAWYRTGDVLKAIQTHGWDREAGEAAAASEGSDVPEETPEASDTGCGGCDNGECCGNGDPCQCCGAVKPEPTPEPEPEPIRPNADLIPQDLRAQADRFYTGVQHRRAFARSRGQKFEQLDSMRIVIDGLKAVKLGVPVEALFSAIEAPWPTETRLQCANFRPTPADLKPQLPEGEYDYGSFAPRPSDFAHAVSAYVDLMIEAGNLVWLHGPAGTGKSSAAKYAAARHAERCGLTGEHTGGRTYFEANCAGAMVSAVKGRDKLNSTVVSDFMLAYEHGGTITLEEFDSSHPSLGTFIGTALAATDGFVNDILERWVPRHKDFRCIVTANSLGYGCPIFKRSDLDAATKDRFRIGRVFTGLDLTLEGRIMESILSS